MIIHKNLPIGPIPPKKISMHGIINYNIFQSV